MRQTSLHFKPKPTANDENMRPHEVGVKRKGPNEGEDPEADSLRSGVPSEPGRPAKARCNQQTIRYFVDSSDDDFATCPSQLPQIAVKKATASPGKDEDRSSGSRSRKGAKSAGCRLSSGGSRPAQANAAGHASPSCSPAKSSRATSRKSPKKSTPRRSSTPRAALPATTPIIGVLHGEAAGALVSSWQFIRCFAHLLDLDGCLPPSLEQLEQCLCDSYDVGVVNQLHICLLKMILAADSSSLLDYGSGEEADEMAAQTGVAGARKRGRPRTTPSKRAQYVPRPNTGLHAWNARDLVVYVDEDTWPEVLRQLIVQWHLRADEEDVVGTTSRFDKAEPEPVLLELAKRLQFEPYTALDVHQRSLALNCLCEHALELLTPHVVGAWESLEQARKADNSQDKATKKVEREERHRVKQVLAGARRSSSEAWAAYSMAEEELDRAAQAYHRCALVQGDVADAKAQMQKAQRARDEARDASRRAKERVRQLQAGGGRGALIAATDADEKPRKQTDRLLSKQEAKAQAEAQKVEAERAARAAEKAVQHEQWKDMVRLRPLGRDADGAVYWLLPRPQPPTDYEYCQPLSAPMLLVEDCDGKWGRVSSVKHLRKSLSMRNMVVESRLRERLAELAASDDHSEEETANLQTPGMAALTPGGNAVHEWIGRRVRRVIQGAPFGGVVSGWRPSRGDGKPAEWYLLYDDGDEEVVEEDDVRAAFDEAADPVVRGLRRRLIKLEETLFGGTQVGKKCAKRQSEDTTTDGDAGNERASYAAEVERVCHVDDFRALLLRLYDEAGKQKDASDGTALEMEGRPPKDPEWAQARRREVEFEWHKRVRASCTMAQLALRASEAQWNLHSQGGVGAGAHLEVRCQGTRDTSAWRSCHVVAVFGDGSFRIVWEESGGRYGTRDVSPVLSRAGQKEQGVVWRFPPAARSSRARPVPSNGLQPVDGEHSLRNKTRPQRASARPKQSYISETSDESGSDHGSTEEGEERELDVDDTIEVMQRNRNGSSGSARRTWVLAKVTRTMRGGAFEVSLVGDQNQKLDKLKLNKTWEGKQWRWYEPVN